MSLEDMRIFAVVARMGSFTGAARQLGLPKQTVSRRVACLEQSLGVQLLLRTTRKVRLTERGLAFSERCQELVRLAEQAAREATEDLFRGPLRLTADEVFGEFFLAPVLADFGLLHPEVRLEAVLTSRMVDLVGEGFDLAVRVGRPPENAVVLGPATIRYCASPAYLDRRGTPLVPSDLGEHECLLSHHDQWPFLEVGRVAVSGHFRCNSFAVVRTACLRGLGIALFPGFACARELASGRLASVLDDYVPEVGAVFLVQPPQRQANARVEAFVQALRVAFAQPPWL